MLPSNSPNNRRGPIDCRAFVAAALFMVGLTAASPACAVPPKVLKSCPKVDTISLVSSAQENDVQPTDGGTGERIDMSVERGVVTITAVGPALGSMDSRNLETDLSCSPEGVILTATIVRSADFQGAALKNVLWRPKISVTFSLRRDPALFRLSWAMRLTTGAAVSRAATPPFAERSYPVALEKMMSLARPAN